MLYSMHKLGVKLAIRDCGCCLFLYGGPNVLKRSLSSYFRIAYCYFFLYDATCRHHGVNVAALVAALIVRFPTPPFCSRPLFIFYFLLLVCSWRS